ncbi:LAMI_0F11298g1_1 [Lachancea mirantina]|uniref:LAMI_0F11298g1_1 n=1 Tax=Lachancea mirantina TaxID=1230905 RepID=A0A1G4K2F4_9SACH|nr:LAMI_0F11298g1_1 [Lachancea mirantina]
MGRIWKQFKTPDGRDYYFNTLTQTSTWERPKDLDEDAGKQDRNKKRKLDEKPKFAILLANDWYLVITSLGNRYFFDSGSGRVSDELDDEASQEIMLRVNREKLVLLIGVARGYDYKGRDAYGEVVGEIESIRNSLSDKNISEGPESATSSPEENSATPQGEAGIVAGYSSSDDAESDAESDDEIGQILIEDVDETSVADREQAFTQLFAKYELDPFSTWSLQSKQINADPEYYLIKDEARRSEIFEGWCIKVLADASKGNEHSIVDESGLDSDDSDEAQFEPTKYHYLAHIVSKSNIKPTTIYKDVKSENKHLFNQFRVKDTITKREQENFVAKLLFYYKKLSLDERQATFTEFLESNRTKIEAGLTDRDKLKQLINMETLPKKSYDIETSLLNIENSMDVYGRNAFLQTEVRYYVLSITEKIKCLQRFFKQTFS